jgi:hypothetical protein
MLKHFVDLYEPRTAQLHFAGHKHPTHIGKAIRSSEIMPQDDPTAAPNMPLTDWQSMTVAIEFLPRPPTPDVADVVILYQEETPKPHFGLIPR